jgi:hypothetical protein
MSLGKILRDLADEVGVDLHELTVLSETVDPFRLDTPRNHQIGRWLADQMQALGLLDRAKPIHTRGIHYALVASGDLRRPDGAPYVSDDKSWLWLKAGASKAARWLGYVPFEKISDARNEEPIIRIHEPFDPELEVTLPEIEVSGFNARQKYHLVFWGEKTSLDDVLGPLAEELEADLYLPAGEVSDSHLHTMARNGAMDGREMIVLVFADCDPAGYQMVVSIGHKLRAFKERFYPRLRFQVLTPALTVDQVRQLGLPSTPLKETELRADGWRERYGVEQTEIDALATLRPELLEQIARNAAEPYFDPTLKDRAQDAEQVWKDEATDQLELALNETAGFQKLHNQITSALKACRLKLRRLQKIVDETTLDLPSPEPLEVEIGDLPDPLVSSEMPLIDAIRILRARKDYTNGGVSKIGVRLGNRTQIDRAKIDRAKRAFRANPAASLREVAKQEGVSTATAVLARKELIAAGEIQSKKM